jgi:hypothetical protein
LFLTCNILEYNVKKKKPLTEKCISFSYSWLNFLESINRNRLIEDSMMHISSNHTNISLIWNTLVPVYQQNKNSISIRESFFLSDIIWKKELNESYSIANTSNNDTQVIQFPGHISGLIVVFFRVTFFSFSFLQYYITWCVHCVVKHSSVRLYVFTLAIHVRNYVYVYTSFTHSLFFFLFLTI